jgi:hypothetical protein
MEQFAEAQVQLVRSLGGTRLTEHTGSMTAFCFNRDFLACTFVSRCEFRVPLRWVCFIFVFYDESSTKAGGLSK